MSAFEAQLQLLVKESKELIESALTTLLQEGGVNPSAITRAVVAVSARFMGNLRDTLVPVVCLLDAILQRLKGDSTLRVLAEFVDALFLEDTTYVQVAKLFLAANKLAPLLRDKVVRFVKRWGTQGLLPIEAVTAMQRAVVEGVIVEPVAADRTSSALGETSASTASSSSTSKGNTGSGGGVSTTAEEATTITKLLAECTARMAALSRHEVRRLRDRLQLGKLRQSASPSELIATLLSVKEALHIAQQERDAQRRGNEAPSASDAAGLRAVLAAVVQQEEEARDRAASDGSSDSDGDSSSNDVAGERSPTLTAKRAKGGNAAGSLARTPYRTPLDSNGTVWSVFGKVVSADGLSSSYRHPKKASSQNRPFRMPLSLSRDRGGAHRCWGLTPDQWALENDLLAVKTATTVTQSVLSTRETTAVGEGSRKREREVKQEDNEYQPL